MICLCVNENSQVHPYLNRRLNDFQRLALITQFFTILGICQSILLCFSELSGAVLLSCARPSCVLLNSCTFNLILTGSLDTIPGGIIYLMVQTLNELHEVTPSDGDEFASYLLALFILTINWLTGIVYPMYRCVHFP